MAGRVPRIFFVLAINVAGFFCMLSEDCLENLISLGFG